MSLNNLARVLLISIAVGSFTVTLVSSATSVAEMRKAPPIASKNGPHGGRLQIAELLGPLSHPVDGKTSLYFEVVQDKGTIIAYPLLQSSGGKTFRAISPRRDLGEITIHVTSKEEPEPIKALTKVDDHRIEVRLHPFQVQRLKMEKGAPLLFRVVVMHDRIPKGASFQLKKQTALGE